MRELVTRSPRYEVWVDRPRALYGSWYEFFPRSEGPVVGGKATHGTFATAAGAAAGDRRHGLRRRLPAADPPDRHGSTARARTHRSSPAATRPTSGPTTSAPRGRSAAPRAGTTPSTRSSARWRTSAPSSPAPASWAWRWRSTSRCRPRRTTRGSRSTRSGSPPSPTARSPTRRTRRRSTRTSTRSTSTTTPRASTPSACGSSGSGSRPGVKIFRVDNPHTKPLNFWHWLIWEVKKTDPDVLFLAEAFTRPAMMHQLARIGFTQSYTYFTWRTERGELEEYGRELAANAHYMRPNFFVNTPDILHESLQFGGPPMFKIRAVLAVDDEPHLGRLLRLRALRARRRPAGQRGVPRQREVPAAPARLGGGRGLRPQPRARTCAGSTRSAGRTRRCSSCARCTSTRSTTRTCSASPRPTRARRTPCSSWSTCPATTPRSGRRRWTCRRSAWTGTSASRVTDELTGATYDWGQFNYLELDPYREPAHVFAVTFPRPVQFPPPVA